MRRWILLAAPLLASACGGSGDPADSDSAELDGKVVSEGRLGPVHARLEMEPAEPRFGDRIHFQLEIEGEGVRLEEMDFQSRLGHFRIRDRTDRGALDEGRFRSRLETEAERSGTNLGRLPPLAFQVLEGEGEGERFVLEMPVFEVEVAGLAPGDRPDLSELGAPLDPVGLPADREGDDRLLVAIGGGLLLAAVLAVVLLRRRRSTPTARVVVDPVAEAERALAALLARGLIEEGRHGEFYVELTAIVCRFIQATTGIHAVEETTEEFLQEISARPEFRDEWRRDLQRFLEASDAVKFAAQVPSSTEIDEAVAAARAFCRRDAVPRREDAA